MINWILDKLFGTVEQNYQRGYDETVKFLNKEHAPFTKLCYVNHALAGTIETGARAKARNRGEQDAIYDHPDHYVQHCVKQHFGENR